MLKYGKMAQNAISAMSYLAEVYDGGTTKLSSGDIAKRRNLPQTLVAKILVVLSQAQLVDGSPRPWWRLLVGSTARRNHIARDRCAVREIG